MVSTGAGADARLLALPERLAPVHYWRLLKRKVQA
jgi:hypothetical protein